MNKNKILTIPNLLSVFRLLLMVPIIILLSQEKRWIAFGLIMLGTFSDSLDGYIARRWNQSSDLGRMLDPIIDKVCVLSLIIFMLIHPAYSFPLWYFLFLLIREVFLLFFGLFIIKKNKVVMESNKAGKLSAFIGGVAVICFIMNFQPYGSVLIWVAFILTLYSSWGYFQQYKTKFKESK